MNDLKPINQTKLFGLDGYFKEFIRLDKKGICPNKILLSGQKGVGKSTLAYHFINYILSKNEEFEYDINNFEIDLNNSSFKTILNKSNPNLILIDIGLEKKFIDINQIRSMISNLNMSSFNNKPRFVLIDNIEFLNINSINSLLKILEEPSYNTYFILINNNKKILPTLLSRCINFKISLSNSETYKITKKLLNRSQFEVINKDLTHYYLTPGVIYNLVYFAKANEYDLTDMNLKLFLKTLIKDNQYKKSELMKTLIYDLIEFYFTKINTTVSSILYNQYTYFLKRISDTKKFNLDEESLFIEFEEKILNG